MQNTSKGELKKNEPKRGRDIYYYRQRLKNRVFSKLLSFFVEEAKRTGVTKKDVAERLKRDPAQITRWLSNPSNLTLDTISDILLALDAEAEPPQIVRFADRAAPNYAHQLIARIEENRSPGGQVAGGILKIIPGPSPLTSSPMTSTNTPTISDLRISKSQVLAN